MAKVLAISSHVVRGHVGLNATVPALQSLGHEVWALPTVLLASRPGLGRMSRHELPAPDLASMLAALEADGCWPMLDAVFTGYFPSPQSVQVAAEAVARIRAAKPSLIVCVDPIIGDAGRLYVAQETAEAIRDRLLPLADVATPNLFELNWLSGASAATAEDIVQSARRLGPATVVVTSASESEQSVGTLLVTRASNSERKTPVRRRIPNGVGDLLAGLFLGRLLMHEPPEAALEASLTGLERVLAASEEEAVLQLAALDRNPMLRVSAPAPRGSSG
jgi:pyridoxine kinase